MGSISKTSNIEEEKAKVVAKNWINSVPQQQQQPLPSLLYLTFFNYLGDYCSSMWASQVRPRVGVYCTRRLVDIISKLITNSMLLRVCTAWKYAGFGQCLAWMSHPPSDWKRNYILQYSYYCTVCTVHNIKCKKIKSFLAAIISNI